MIADRRFLYVSKISLVRDEINVCVVSINPPPSTSIPQVIAEKFPEGARTEPTLQPSVVRDKNTIRLCVACKTEDQVSGQVDDFAGSGVYHRTRPSVVPDCIESLIRGDLIIRLSYLEPKAVEVERLVVVLVGQSADR